MVSSLLLSLPDSLAIDQVRVLYECVTVCVRSVAPLAMCPLCSRPSKRVHSRYRRTIADLPHGGRQVVLSLQVRKFFCQTRDCPRHIFAERLAELERFGRGIEQDKAAVSAGLSLPFSNGVVEGQVNRLKLIKRMMYGRAGFLLLRQRMLQCA